MKEIKHFYDEVANSYFTSFYDFLNIYRNITNVPHNFILIDGDPKSDDLKIRKNFNGLIHINDHYDVPVVNSPNKKNNKNNNNNK